MSTRAACPGGARVEIKLTYHPYPTSRNILPHRIIPRLFHTFSQSYSTRWQHYLSQRSLSQSPLSMRQCRVNNRPSYPPSQLLSRNQTREHEKEY
jgi:hypothetical protein